MPVQYQNNGNQQGGYGQYDPYNNQQQPPAQQTPYATRYDDVEQGNGGYGEWKWLAC